jgi:hypothetical protein
MMAASKKKSSRKPKEKPIGVSPETKEIVLPENQETESFIDENINLEGLDKDSQDSIDLFEDFLRDIINGKHISPEKKIQLGFQAARVLIELKKRKAETTDILKGEEDLSHLSDADICRILNREPADRYGNIQNLSSFADFQSSDISKKPKDFKLPEEAGKDEEPMEAFDPDDIESGKTEDTYTGEEGILPA